LEAVRQAARAGRVTRRRLLRDVLAERADQQAAALTFVQQERQRAQASVRRTRR
jgi:hypothetical protein